MENATVSKFIAAIDRLLDSSTTNARIGLAVSGGPDSLALLLLAHAAFPDRIAAATVDHGLRAEAAAEAEYVARLCAERGIAHNILRPAEPITGNIQSSARSVRYALLGDWAAAHDLNYIATAHHGDDQLETMLMRLARGSGVDGLSAVRARNGNIIRPLLGFSKAELIAICTDAGITPISDPSNLDDDFDRVRMRKWLAQSGHDFDLGAINRSASALSDASEAITWMVEKLADARIHKNDGSITLDASKLPRELQRRLLLRALSLIDDSAQPRGHSIDRALDGLNNGQNMMLGNTACAGGALWTFKPAPPRR